jgi:hypothetical protein
MLLADERRAARRLVVSRAPRVRSLLVANVVVGQGIGQRAAKVHQSFGHGEAHAFVKANAGEILDLAIRGKLDAAV